MIAVLLLLAALAAFVGLLFGAVVELHRQVLQLRMQAGLVDNAMPLDVNQDVALSELPIPAVAGIDAQARSAVLLLSDSCSTCADVGRHYAKRVASGLMAVVEARSVSDAARWINAQGMKVAENVVYDNDGAIAELLGVRVAPAVVKFEAGKPAGASTVPTARQLDLVIDWLTSRRSESTVGTG